MRLAKFVRKIVLVSIGLPLLVVGLILIPLPGPGVLLTVVALFILSFELDWAEKFYQERKKDLQNIYRESKKRYDEMNDKLS